MISCRKEHSLEGGDFHLCPLVLDSTGFEDARIGLYEVDGWNIPVHSSVTAYDPISENKSLYGYFLKDHAWVAETREFQFKQYLNIKFKYRLYSKPESQNLKFQITLNGNLLIEKPVIDGEIQSINETFNITAEKGRIAFVFFQESAIGRNVWIDDVVITTGQLCK
jgi:hypothetical protein